MTTPTTTAPATFEQAQKVLAARLPGYTERPEQIALGTVIEQGIADEKIVAAQAGTGIGKSFAGLIPAIQSGKRTIIATATKVLQGQYAAKDLPFLQEYLGIDFTWAVIKGRSNYPCQAKAAELKTPTHRQREVLDRMAACSTPEAIKAGEIIDREDFPALTDDEYRDFSMSAAECPGATGCPFATKCFAERAKAKASTADVVITNTALLLLDLVLRSQTQGNVALLGEIEQLIIDEAHKLEEATTSALEDTMGQGTFRKLSRDLAAFLEAHGEDPEAALAVEAAANTLWDVLDRAYAAFLVKSRGKVEPLGLPLSHIIDGELGESFINLYSVIRDAHQAVKDTRVFEDRDKIQRARLLRRALGQLSRLEAYTTDADEKTVRWLEQETSTWRGDKQVKLWLRSAPVRVAPFLRKALWSEIPTVMVSATLTTGVKAGKPDFTFMMETLGLDPADTVTFDAGSPFDYQRQALTFIPGEKAPEPAGQTVGAWRAYAQSVSLDLIKASKGGAFLLYTSRSAMNEAYAALGPQLERMGLLVLRQGDYPTSEMIRLFKEDGNAVLFGLKSFFEGVDISGRALRLVVLDKLPFSNPNDLLHEARKDDLNRRYADKWAGFTRLTIPMMTLILIQAYGRLIRHAGDQGVVAILDNRLRTKRYGQNIRKALPPAPQTDSLTEAQRFLAGIQ